MTVKTCLLQRGIMLLAVTYPAVTSFPHAGLRSQVSLLNPKAALPRTPCAPAVPARAPFNPPAMTDRLADLQRGERFSTASADADIEAGLDDQSEALLQSFTREADAIERVLVWGDSVISDVTAALASSSCDVPLQGSQLDAVETKMQAVRRRLKKMADDNRSFAAEHSGRPATVRTRLVHYTKLGKDFITITGRLSAVREKHRTVLKDGLKRAVRDVNPDVSERAVDAALREGGQIDDMLVGRGSHMEHQIADIRARNADIQKLVKNIADINQMFQDMSILVESQQTLINDIEYNVQEVKADVKSAGEELVQARAHQKSKNKKKMCVILLILIIIAIIVIAILASVLTK